MRRMLTAMAVTGTTVCALLGATAAANATTTPPRLDAVDTQDRDLFDDIFSAIETAIDNLVEAVVGD